MDIRQGTVRDFSKAMFDFAKLREEKKKPVFDFKDTPDIIGCIREKGDHSPGVYQKLDYVTCIFRNCTIDEVLEWCGLEPAEFATDFYQSSYVAAADGGAGYLAFKMEFHHIKLEIKEVYMYVLSRDETFFQQIVPEMRLSISGQGLDWLRYRGIDVDVIFRKEDRLPVGAHFTRVDFAYDFINYRGDFVEQLLDYCRKNQTPSQMLSCGKAGRAFKWSYRDVREMTVYVGTRASKRMLRCYDKRLQYIDFDSKCYVKDNPYGDPDTWIRVEWETKDDVAHKLILDECNLDGILKEIYEYYQFQDVENTTQHTRRPAEFWKNLFDWDFIKGTVQNIKFVHVPKNPGTVSPWVGQFLRFLMYHGENGLQELFFQVESYLDALHNPAPDVSPALADRRLRKFYNRMKEVSLLLNIDEDKMLDPLSNSPLYRGSDKKLHFRLLVTEDLQTEAYKSLKEEVVHLKEENSSLKFSLLQCSGDTVSKERYDELKAKYEHVLSLCISAGLGDMVKG